jgi:hypothetical protein
MRNKECRRESGILNSDQGIWKEKEEMGIREGNLEGNLEYRIRNQEY